MAETTPAQAAQPEDARRRVAEVARQQPGRAAARQRDETVFVWPNLLIIEFIAALVMMLLLMVLSWLVNAPLEAHANPDRTPNPSKAPWYFLNLQELLLHMHPALAGVLVPAIALGLIAIIPYFDRDPRDVGKWFGTPKALAITWFMTWYTTIWLFVLVVFDELVGVKPTMNNLERSTGIGVFTWPFVVNVIAPMICMSVPIVLMVWLLKKTIKPDGPR